MLRSLLASAAALLALAIPASAGAAAPNLTVTKVAEPPSAVKQGGSFKVRDTTANRGAGNAGRSDTRFYLKPFDSKLKVRQRSLKNDLTDLLLAGARAVPALKAGKNSVARKPTTLGVPVYTNPGRYWLLACADDRGAVKEKSETDNCRASTKTVTVTGDATQYETAALSDLFQDPLESQDLADLQQFQAVACSVTPSRKLSPAAAIKSAKDFLRRTAGADAAQAFAASDEYKNATKAQNAAFAAVARGKPGAALAALLRAHELQPKEASHLQNAAALGTSVGLPNEGLAMLDAAAKLDDRDLPALGISREATQLAIRGQALGMLGRWDDAKKAFNGALAKEPLLTEAKAGLAAATLCKGDAPGAVPFARASRHRTPEVPPIDESKGIPHELRQIMLPGSSMQAVQMKPYFDAQQQRLLGETGTFINRRNAIEGRLRAAEARLTPAARRYVDGLQRKISSISANGTALDAEGKAVNDKLQKALTTNTNFWGQGTTDDNYRLYEFIQVADRDCQGQPNYSVCHLNRMRAQCVPALKLEHAKWLDEMHEAYAAAQAYHRHWSTRVSALAAHFGNADQVALWQLEIEQHESNWYGNVIQPAGYWTHNAKQWDNECVQNDQVDVPDPGSPAAGAAGAQSCPAGLKALATSIDIGIGSLKINCEEISLSGKFQPVEDDWVYGYGEITYDVRAQKLTVFAGSAGEIGAAGVVGEFKSGVYVKVSNDGIEDVGWRVGPSSKVAVGPIEYETFKDEIDMSFVGALSYTFGGE